MLKLVYAPHISLIVVDGHPNENWKALCILQLQFLIVGDSPQMSDRKQKPHVRILVLYSSRGIEAGVCWIDLDVSLRYCLYNKCTSPFHLQLGTSLNVFKLMLGTRPVTIFIRVCFIDFCFQPRIRQRHKFKNVPRSDKATVQIETPKAHRTPSKMLSIVNVVSNDYRSSVNLWILKAVWWEFLPSCYKLWWKSK